MMRKRRRALWRMPMRRLILRIVILRGLGRGILIRTTVDDRDVVAPVAVRRRRRGRPFERVAVPRVLPRRLAPEQADEEVGHKNQLRQTQNERTDTDELIHPI